MRHASPPASLVVTGALLVVAAAATGGASRGPARPTVGVEVALVLSGDVGQFAGQCGALGGTDSLTGILARDGSGPVAPDEDVMYRGLLSRTTNVGACGTKPSPTEDQVTFCTATLLGTAKMDVELEVYEGDRGAYIKMKANPDYPVTKLVRGCVEPSDWLKDYYPDGASGISIETVPSGLLRKGVYTDAGTTLTVIRE